MTHRGSYDSLVIRAQAGDTAALEELLLASHPDLRRFAGRVCNTGEDAEDAVQHALLVVSEKIGTLRAAGRFTAWVFTVIRNQCGRYGKAAARWVGIGGEESQLALPASQEASVDRERLARQLAHAIAELPESHRDVFMLRELEELSSAQTAEKLDISVANVKVRLHRARSELRIALRSPVD